MPRTARNRIASLIPAGLALLLSSNGYGGPDAPAAAIAAIKQAQERGLFDCTRHLQSDQCGASNRCRRALVFLGRAEGGSEEALRQLSAFIDASSEQELCVRSLQGPYFDALSEGLGALETAAPATESAGR